MGICSCVTEVFNKFIRNLNVSDVQQNQENMKPVALQVVSPNDLQDPFLV